MMIVFSASFKIKMLLLTVSFSDLYLKSFKMLLSITFLNIMQIFGHQLWISLKSTITNKNLKIYDVSDLTQSWNKIVSLI